MKITAKSGSTLAAAAAALILAGAVAAPAVAEHHEGKGKCMGANACKGQGACGTATNSCGGKNECKGKGWLEMTKADCDKAGGKFEAAKMEKK